MTTERYDWEAIVNGACPVAARARGDNSPRGGGGQAGRDARARRAPERARL
jgi:hypothetical protein